MKSAPSSAALSISVGVIVPGIVMTSRARPTSSISGMSAGLTRKRAPASTESSACAPERTVPAPTIAPCLANVSSVASFAMSSYASGTVSVISTRRTPASAIQRAARSAISGVAVRMTATSRSSPKIRTRSRRSARGCCVVVISGNRIARRPRDGRRHAAGELLRRREVLGSETAPRFRIGERHRAPHLTVNPQRNAHPGADAAFEQLAQVVAVPSEALQTVGVDVVPDQRPCLAKHLPHRMRSERIAPVAARDSPVRALDVDLQRSKGHAPQRSIRFEQSDRAEIGELRHRESRDLLEAPLHGGLLAQRLPSFEEESHSAFSRFRRTTRAPLGLEQRSTIDRACDPFGDETQQAELVGRE